MELREAIAAVQSLRNLFRGLEKLDEVLKVAQGAETVIAERQKAVEKAGADLAEVSKNLSEAKAKAEAEVTRARIATAEAVGALNLKVEEASKQASDVQARLAASVKAAEADAAVRKEAIETEMRTLVAEKAKLVQSVKALQSQLAQLKDRAARV